MPVEFLSDEQAARFGCYPDEPSQEQLARHFFLSAADSAFLAARRRAANKLGCAVQLCTLRFLGTFLTDPLRVPALVAQTLAGQLGLSVEALSGYRTQLNTWYDHQARIIAHLGYIPFDGPQAFRLTRRLYAQVLTSTVRPSVLFDLTTAHLVAQRVVLPGVSLLARLSPLLHEHVNMLGRYDFSLPEDIAAGEMRPLATPSVGKNGWPNFLSVVFRSYSSATPYTTCMKIPSPPSAPPGATPPAGQQFSYLLRHGRFSVTERELQEHLQMTYRTIKQREADPSGLTVAEALRVAELLAVPVQTVLDAALADVQVAQQVKS